MEQGYNLCTRKHDYVVVLPTFACRLVHGMVICVHVFLKICFIHKLHMAIWAGKGVFYKIKILNGKICHLINVYVNNIT